MALSKTVSESEQPINNPKRWIKRNLPAHLIGRFFLGLLMALPVTLVGTYLSLLGKTITGTYLVSTIVCFVIVIFIFSMCCLGSAKRKGGNRLPTKRSVIYGTGNIGSFHFSLLFRILYSAIWGIVGLVSSVMIFLFLIPLLTEIEGGWEVFGYGLSAGVANLASMQIHGVLFFKNRIKKFACSCCGQVNTIRANGTCDYQSKVEERVVATKGGNQVKTGTVYVDGKEVGSTYGTTPTYNVYQKYRVSTWKECFRCEICGNETTRSKSSSQTVGNRYQ